MSDEILLKIGDVVKLKSQEPNRDMAMTVSKVSDFIGNNNISEFRVNVLYVYNGDIIEKTVPHGCLRFIK